MPHPAAGVVLLFVKFPTLWFVVLGADGLGSSELREELDFQMDPIFDWMILPLYMPGAGFDEGPAVGGFGGSAATFLGFDARVMVEAWL